MKITIKIFCCTFFLLLMLGSNVFAGANPTMVGIDVSRHQGFIDWDLVCSNIDFAIIRCGFGNDDISQDDTQWYNNANACTRLDIPFSVYIYSYATNTTMAESEANHVLRLIDGYNLSFPIYLDMEDNVQANLPASERGAIALTFCNIIQKAGYEVGIYANKNWWENYLTDAVFNNNSWHKWVAQYNSSCTYAGNYTMWQYTSSGNINGINGRVDMNYWYGDGNKIDNSATVNTTVVATPAPILDDKPDQTPMQTLSPVPTLDLSLVLKVFSGKNLQIAVDNKVVRFPDAKPFIDINNRTQIPIRAVAEMLNCDVDWISDTNTVIIKNNDGNVIIITIGSNVMIHNGNKVSMDTDALIKDDRTYIPIRFVAEALGLTVEWE